MKLLVEFLLPPSVQADIPATLAGKIRWVYKALEERGKVMNSAVTRRFLESEGGGGKEDEDRILVVCDTGGCVQPGGWVYS